MFQFRQIIIMIVMPVLLSSAERYCYHYHNKSLKDSHRQSARGIQCFVKVSTANMSFLSDPITILFSLLCFAVAS